MKFISPLLLDDKDEDSGGGIVVVVVDDDVDDDDGGDCDGNASRSNDKSSWNLFWNTLISTIIIQNKNVNK